MNELAKVSMAVMNQLLNKLHINVIHDITTIIHNVDQLKSYLERYEIFEYIMLFIMKTKNYVLFNIMQKFYPKLLYGKWYGIDLFRQRDMFQKIYLFYFNNCEIIDPESEFFFKPLDYQPSDQYISNVIAICLIYNSHQKQMWRKIINSKYNNDTLYNEIFEYGSGFKRLIITVDDECKVKLLNRFLHIVNIVAEESINNPMNMKIKILLKIIYPLLTDMLRHISIILPNYDFGTRISQIIINNKLWDGLIYFNDKFKWNQLVDNLKFLSTSTGIIDICSKWKHVSLEIPCEFLQLAPAGINHIFKIYGEIYAESFLIKIESSDLSCVDYRNYHVILNMMHKYPLFTFKFVKLFGKIKALCLKELESDESIEYFDTLYHPKFFKKLLTSINLSNYPYLSKQFNIFLNKF